MRLAGHSNGIPLAVTAAALALLPVLATLQYRWIGQVSRAERESLESDLRVATLRFTDDFDRTLRRAMAGMELRSRETGPGEDDAPGEISWRNAPDFKVFRAFYIAEGENLQKWKEQAGRLEPASWPDHWTALRARLAGNHRRRLPLELELDEGLALVVAPRRALYPPWLARRRFASSSGWAIAELDLSYLREQLLPELVARHFSAGALDYQVEIVSQGDPANVIYRSAAGLPANFAAQADARRLLLDPRPERLPRPPGPGRALAPPPREPPDTEGWLLAVRPRLGSLEAVVNQTRYRSLVVSFAILVLLGAGMAVLAVSARRAQRLARLQMQFVAGVSHELRTPLAVICSAGENMADGVVTGAEQVRRYGAVVRDEGRRLAEMVEETLGFAGIQAGRMRFESQPVDLAALVQQAVSACRGDAAGTGCEIEMQIEPELPMVIGDARYLAQCLRNLLSNALKYAQESNWIGVRAARTGADDAAEVRVTVEDRGPGIDRADLPHIFDPFYRGRNALSAQIQGAGLGLSLVKNIMEAHGGTVEVSSTPGGGSRFTLHLPAILKGAPRPA